MTRRKIPPRTRDTQTPIPGSRAAGRSCSRQGPKARRGPRGPRDRRARLA